MIRPVLRRLSPAGPQARLSTLIFHRVLTEPDPLFPAEIDASGFDAVCGWLAAWFTVLPLDEAVRRLEEGSLPERALSITFDDGYRDNHDVALPILRRHGLAATFFIATGFLDGGRMWNDTAIESIRRTSLRHIDLRGIGGIDFDVTPVDSIAARRVAIERIIGATKYMEPARRQAVVDTIAERAEAALPGDLMMASDQVRAMRTAGMQIGAHTESHPILARLGRAAARREIEQSKHVLEALIGEPVDLFAYPNGKPIEDYSDASVALVRDAGFRAAVSTAPGAADRRSDRYQLPRFTPWDRTRLKFAARLGLNLWTSRT
jgi:peptidoglycan/xylan/chitin deacetylase (PgdA/CDA1 family)